jgi:hypothetical protein
VARKTTDAAEFYLLDIATGTGRLLARTGVSGELFVAPDGRRVVISEITAARLVRLRLIGLEDGQERSVDLAIPPPVGRNGTVVELPPSTSLAFRPRSAEVWYFINRRLYVIDDVVTFVDRPVEPLRRIEKLGASPNPSAGLRAPPLRAERSSIFTADGARWLFDGSDDMTRLGNADRPADDEGLVLAGHVFYDEGDIIELSPGGKIAFEDGWPGRRGRRDLYLAEPPWQSRRLLANDVAEVRFGADRALAVVRPIGAPARERRFGVGDLVLLDLASGAETLLARNVVSAALRPCAGCDLTSPGTTLSYAVQARVPHRFDGLWLGALP